MSRRFVHAFAVESATNIEEDKSMSRNLLIWKKEVKSFFFENFLNCKVEEFNLEVSTSDWRVDSHVTMKHLSLVYLHNKL
jgi:hypothetical protein